MSEKPLQSRIEELERLLGIVERGKHMWESTFDAITQPVHIISSDYIIQRANLAESQIPKLHIRDVIGKKCFEAFAGRNSPCEGCPMQRAITKNGSHKELLKNEIHEHEFEVNAFPYKSDDGEKVSAVVYYRDVTEEKRLQREVIQQEKMAAIGILAGGVAHEINNPLSGIIAFTQLLKKDVGEQESIKEDLKEIEKAALRCKKIVADLLDYSRASREQERCPVDLNGLLERIFPFIKGELTSYNVNFNFEEGKGIPPVIGNPDRLQQVFLNLMTNACHSMPHGGKLSVRTSQKDSAVRIEVEDSGVGIPEKDMNKIFDPFFTTKEPGKGTGLGLSISYRIIKEHGGRIEAKSEEGKGTLFSVELPVANLSKGE
ncbi:MAG: ATP-binding protein [Pseudomonadota bacterium]